MLARHVARTKFLRGKAKIWGGNGFALISKSKKEKIFTEKRADFVPNFSEDQKKKKNLVKIYRGVKVWFYSKLADLGNFVPNHLGRGGQRNVFRYKMHEILLKMTFN